MACWLIQIQMAIVQKKTPFIQIRHNTCSRISYVDKEGGQMLESSAAQARECGSRA